MKMESSCQSVDLALTPEKKIANLCQSDSKSLKDIYGKASTSDIFLTHKLKTQRSAMTIQSHCSAHNISQNQSKITIITKNVQPLDIFKKKSDLQTIEEVYQINDAKKLKNRYFQHKLDQISYNLKSAYLKKYKLSKSVRLKIPSDNSSPIKQNKKKWLNLQNESFSLPYQIPINQYSSYSASVHLQTIYQDKNNKIAPKNIQKYHDNFQLLKCAFQKNAEQKINRIFQRQKQLQIERDLIKQQIASKMKKKAHSMRARLIQQTDDDDNVQITERIGKKSARKSQLPKLRGHYIAPYSEASVNVNQKKIDTKKDHFLLLSQKQKASKMQYSPIRRCRFKTII